jgi:tetratricopeptide (TPR) repeat protein
VHSVDIKPWRFDHAREAALALVPEDVDICVSLDLDQIIARNWRAILEKHWKPPHNRVFYTLAWSKNHDGTARTVLDNRIHARRGFRWRYPVHECVLAEEGVAEHILLIRHLVIDHLPDPEKSRGQYLGLLELAAREEPQRSRHAHYLGREYYFLGRWADAIAEFERQFTLNDDPADLERNSSLRLSALCHDRLGEDEKALALFRQAVEEIPTGRGGLTDLAWALYQRERWVECYEVAVRGAATPVISESYGLQSDTGVTPEDMAAICGWRLGRHREALAYGRRAMALQPSVERIRRNVEQMEEALNAQGSKPQRGEVRLT